MYLLIQKRINYILTILFIFLAILLYILFFPIFRYWGFTGMIISFMTLILIFHFLIDNVLIYVVKTDLFCFMRSAFLLYITLISCHNYLNI